MTIEEALNIIEINDKCVKELAEDKCHNYNCDLCEYNLSPKEFNEAVHVLYGAVKTDISKKPKGPAIKVTLLTGGDEDVH
ncbi:MAG: hypothetical protein J6U54_17725 [Clostridiales bacterium]|nr:hypothetical protein [Clostridiales bacterium]